MLRNQARRLPRWQRAKVLPCCVSMVSKIDTLFLLARFFITITSFIYHLRTLAIPAPVTHTRYIASYPASIMMCLH